MVASQPKHCHATPRSHAANALGRSKHAHDTRHETTKKINLSCSWKGTKGAHTVLCLQRVGRIHGFQGTSAAETAYSLQTLAYANACQRAGQSVNRPCFPNTIHFACLAMKAAILGSAMSATVICSRLSRRSNKGGRDVNNTESSRDGQVLACSALLRDKRKDAKQQ